MMTRTSFSRLAGLALLAWGVPAPASGQVVERDVSVTGPRGNTIERHTRTERHGNYVDRQVDIRRPEGTYHRETEVYAPPPRHGHPQRPIPVGGGAGFVGGGFVGGPRVIERDVIIERPAPAAAFLGIGGPSFGLFLGSPPPPPIYYGPPPVVFAPAPPPVVVYNPPVRYAPPPPPATVVVDPVEDAAGRLRSLHSNSRREGAITLGKLGDARGVPPLIDRLQHDHEKEVRMAAAWALAEIGDPRAIVPLETAAQFDKRADVRAVAAKSLARIPADLGSPADAPVDPTARVKPSWNPPASSAAPAPGPNLDDLPPPDPTPATARASSPAPRRDR